jgi:hypothetical protein
MKKHKPQHRPVGEPEFLYFSVCCQAIGKKPPCVKVPAKERETNSLGTWRCSKCGQVCSVTRTPNTPNKPIDTSAPTVA